MVAGIVIALVFLLAFAVVWGLPRYLYNFVIRGKASESNIPIFQAAREKPAPDVPPPWFTVQPYETVRILSRDGLRLSACFLPAAAGSGLSPRTAILAHGYTGHVFQMSAFARFFCEKLGYNVLLPNARGHGDSEGNYIGMGWHDRLDYLQWIDWVKERASPGESPAVIVLFGISMGAATVMMTSGETLPPEVKAVIEDCGYTSVEEELRYQLLTLYHLKSRLLIDAVSRLTQKRAGYSFAEASSLEQVKKTRVPTLFIHGEEDTFVPFTMVRTLYEACPAPKELFTVPGAGHGECYSIAGLEYEARITAFLKRWAP